MTGRTTVVDSPRTLVEGQRLDQPTFHALYAAMPPGTRAELIDGVVHMPSPVGLEHGEAQVPVDGLYRSTVFPGLWLDPIALLNADRRRIRAVVDVGCA